jgi:hypothetical protein
LTKPCVCRAPFVGAPRTARVSRCVR